MVWAQLPAGEKLNKATSSCPCAVAGRWGEVAAVLMQLLAVWSQLSSPPSGICGHAAAGDWFGGGEAVAETGRNGGDMGTASIYLSLM